MGANAGVRQGSIQWGDYDNDADLDLAVSGLDGGANRRLIIYRNAGGGSFTNVAEPMGANAGVQDGSIQWGDYDNDGRLDLAVSGAIDGGTNKRLIIYRNDGGGSFTNAAEPMGANAGVYAGSIQWSDYDNDGDLDLAVSGNDGTNKRLIIYRSDAIAPPNVRPNTPAINAPKGASVAQGDTVTFRWTKVTGDTTPDTGMTYNLRVGTASDKADIFAADTNSADSVGNAILGNVQNDTSAELVRSLTVGQTYYWSVQAVDQGMMRSAWATEETFTITLVPNTSGVWYVNDTSIVGDSWTTAIGYDTAAGNGTASNPYRTITYALSQALSGDTIYIDAGLYAETVVIDTDNIALIGKDSTATVIDPPGSDTGIYASGKSYLLIRSIGVTGAYDGIVFNNVDYSRLDADSAGGNSNYGVVLRNGSDTNTIVNGIFNSNASRGVVLWASYNDTVQTCVAASNSGVGIGVFSSGGGHTFTGNTTNSNTTAGIQIGAGIGGNLVKNNTITTSPNMGIYILNAPNNTIIGNIVKGAQPGIEVSASRNTIRNNFISQNSNGAGVYINGIADTNIVEQNDIAGNETGVMVILQARNNVIQKNNITGNTWELINRGGLAQTTGRNWFGSADSATIAAKISDTASAWQPWRLSRVDTSAGADTTAPDAPDTVAVTPSDTSLIVTWQGVSALEEPNGGAVGLSGYRIYRSPVISDTSLWTQIAQVGSTADGWQDTSPFVGKVYYYRVTAFDAASPYINESFYSDSIPGDSAPYTSQTDWYVNDGSTAGDSYTYATGSDISGNGSKQTPFASIPKAMTAATAGDTIWIDAGLYDSYVVISATETAGVNIDKDSITLIGKDSASTIIDPPGANSTSGLYGIYADTQVGLLIKNLGLTGAYDGIHFVNVDQVTLSGDSFSYNGRHGVILLNGADTNSVTGNAIDSNGSDGLELSAGAGCTISGNQVNFNGAAGILLSANASNNTVSNNAARQNATHGIHLNPADSNTISGNTLESNPTGIYLQTSHNNMISNNIADSNTNGIYLHQGSNLNTVSGNSANANAAVAGIMVDGGTNDTIINNTANSNSQDGIFINASTAITITGNTVQSNLINGIDAAGGNTGLLIADNIARSNTQHGIYLSASADLTARNNFVRFNAQAGILLEFAESIVISQNDVSGNDTGIWITGDASNNLILKNNISGNTVSNLYNQSGVAQTLARNWWGTSDEVTIAEKIADPSGSVWRPYRLELVDTAAGADTVAPESPSSVTLDTSTPGQITLTWVNPTINEDSDLGTVGFAGLNIFRLVNQPDSSNWSDGIYVVRQTTALETTWIDTDVTGGNTYYYRLTSKDTAPFVNESFAMDTYWATAAVAYSGPSWYVNDTSTSGDSYTSAIGDDTTGAGSAGAPYATITKALLMAKSGDTIYVDPGAYTAPVVIDTDNLTLVGADNSLAVIDVGASGDGISATGRTGLSIQNIGVVNALNGVLFNQVTNSTISTAYIFGCSTNGIRLTNGSDTNTLIGNTAFSCPNGIDLEASAFNTLTYNSVSTNSAINIHLLGASNNTLSNNYADGGSGDGIYLDSGSNNNTLETNSAGGNTGSGIVIAGSSYNNIYGNIADTNGAQGVYLQANSTGNTINSNSVAGNATGIYAAPNADSNIIAANAALSNTSFGIYLSGCTGNTVSGNTADYNTSYGIWLSACANTALNGNEAASNSDYGILLGGGSMNNAVSGNVSMLNATVGIYLAGSSNNTIVDNAIRANTTNGVEFSASSDNNILMNNGITANGMDGVEIGNSSNNIMVQNLIASNTQYQIFWYGTSSANLISKNNISYAPGNPPLSAYIAPTAAPAVIDLTRNWWGSTDTAEILAMTVYQGTNGDTLVFTPFRIGVVDTTAGADTVAPESPETVAADAPVSAGYVRITWSAVTANEDGDAGAADVSSYRIYRSLTGDTSDWVEAIGTAAGDNFIDTSVALGTTYYYRVTAVDTATTPNESFYSDSIVSATPPMYDGPAWFVNDTSAAGDSYTSASGSDGTGDGSAGAPFRTIAKALDMAASGETIYIDAGYYTETAVIDTDDITISGVDSGATVISAGSTGDPVIHAQNCANVRIEKLGVRNGYSGLRLDNVNGAYIEGVEAKDNQWFGVAISGGTNHTLVYISATGTETAGVYIDNTSGDSIQNCYSSSNGTNGFELWNSVGSMWSGNTASNNSGAGFQVRSCASNSFSGNTADSNASNGMELASSTANLVKGNRIAGNQQDGVLLDSSSLNVFSQNDISSNAGYQVYVTDGSESNWFARNNILPGGTFPDSAVLNTSGNAQDFQRNWWGTTDEFIIELRLIDTSGSNLVQFSPYGLGVVDTSLAGDSLAPSSPTGASANGGTPGQVTVTWSDPVVDEYGGGLSDLAGIKIYRLVDSFDTPNWANLPVKYVAAAVGSWVDTDVIAGHTYRYRLTAYDGAAFINESFFSDSVGASALNHAPYIAPAIANQMDSEDTSPWSIALSSYAGDTDGDPLTWSVTGGGTVVSASVTGGETLDITPTANAYGVDNLTVYLTDGQDTASQVVSVTLTSVNDAPVADAGSDTAIAAGATAYLTGSGSSDVEGAVTYLWTQLAGPAMTLSPDSVTADVSFVSDTAYLGDYIFQLTVGDGIDTSADTVVISAGNVAPVADAGSETVSVTHPDTVNLNGGASYDSNGDTLYYLWTIVSGPTSPAISGADSVAASFVADSVGVYVVTLEVFDGTDTTTDTLDVTALNTAPTANAGPDTSVTAGATAQIFGSASSDPNGDMISYSWTQTGGPSVELSDSFAANPTFVPVIAATYYFDLAASDGFDSATDQVMVTVTAGAPAVMEKSVDTHILADTYEQAVLAVHVLDANGNCVPSEAVTFEVTYPSTGNDAGISPAAAYTDGSGIAQTTVYLSSATASSFYRVRASVSGLTQDFYVYNNKLHFAAQVSAGNNRGWKMWSYNGVPAATTVADAITPYLSDADIYEWQAGTNENTSLAGASGTHYYAPSVIERGRAYWIKSNAGGTLRITPGLTSPSETVAVSLIAGWNQVGTGQFFFTDWDKSVRFFRPTDSEHLDTLTPQQAEDSGLIQNAAYWWSEDDSTYYWGPDTAMYPQVQMKPMAGFWLLVNSAVEMLIMPIPAEPQDSVEILNQAPAYRADKGTSYARRQGDKGRTLSAYYKQNHKTGGENDWAIQLMASGGGSRDVQNYVGVKATAGAAKAASRFEPPATAGGYVALAVRRSDERTNGRTEWMAALFSEPVTATDARDAGRAWDVMVASDIGQAVTLAWDNVENLPSGYEAYLIGAPNGPVNLRTVSSVSFPLSQRPLVSLSLVLGAPEFLAPYLAAPLSKENTFVYPNPGPDGTTGNMTFAYNLGAAGDVKIKIFDASGRLVRELTGTGAAGANTVVWDTTNRHGQKVGSGVYIYKIESGGDKLVDKLAIVR